MNGDAYYQHQAVARGLGNLQDVQTLLKQQSAVYRRLLLAWMPASKDACIYEVACGPGLMLGWMRQEGFANISGSDSAECQVALSRQAGFSVNQADSIEELRKQPASALDCIIGIDFIEHLPKDALIEFLAQSYRVLKPGGCIILHAPNADSPLLGRHLFNDITHHWAYTSIAMRALLEMAGFSKVEFADESLAAIERQRWLKVPMMRLAQWGLRFVIRAATRENVQYLSPSLFTAAWKAQA